MRYLIVLAALAATPALAQTQADMNRQTGTDFKRADAAMNVQYRTTMAAMKRMDGVNAPDARTGPSYGDALLCAQRAWLAYRDADCLAFGYQFRGGSAQGMAQGQCRARVTNARTAELRDLARAVTPR